MPSLSEMRAAKSEPPQRPHTTKTVTLVEGQHILDQIEALTREAQDEFAQAIRQANEDGEREGPPLKAAERSTPARVEEIRRLIPELEAKLGEEFQAEVGLSGLDGGEWQRFKLQHPPRIIGNHETTRQNGDVVKGPPIYDPVDAAVTDGHCDATALFAALGRFVTEWEGEPLGPGEWDDWLAERITYGDRRDLVRAVVDLHELVVSRVPKSRPVLSATESGASG